MTLKELPVGSIITDKKTKFNGKPIEWLVADHTKYADGTVLLSKDILCCRPFDEPKEYYEDEYRKEYGSNRWSTSDLRKWLNNEFFGKAFSSRLADIVIPVSNATVLSRHDRELCEVDRTKDTVFLLSDIEISGKVYDETLELFKGESKKYLTAECCPGLTWWWWLRSPYAGSSYSARIVVTDGSLGNSTAFYGNTGVRPACAISSSAPVKIRKSGGYRFDWER
jgi:hypothetical protein